MTRAGRTLLTVLALVGGLALLAWQVHLVTWATIRAQSASLGYGFAGILALSGLRYVVRAQAWRTLMGGAVGLGRTTRAVVAGDAVGNLTVLRLLASEPTKALLLGPGVVTSRALAALVAENVFYSASVAFVIALGAGAMLVAFALPGEVRGLGWASLALMTGLLAVTVGIIWRRPAIVSRLLGVVPGLSRDRIEGLVARVRDFETTTYEFVAGHPARIAVVIACELIFHALSFAETYLTLWLITGRSTPLAAFVLDTVNRIINVVFIMVPFKVGVAEAGNGMVADAVGVGQAVGVTMALVTKLRVLAWAAVGLALLGVGEKGLRKSFFRKT
jgi:hypothetical protein